MIFTSGRAAGRRSAEWYFTTGFGAQVDLSGCVF